MESLSQALRRLEARGYAFSFHAENGQLRCVESEQQLDPERLVVDEVVRLEDDSNPSEQSMVFALRNPDDGRRGTWTVVHGPRTAPANVEIMQRLRKGTKQWSL